MGRSGPGATLGSDLKPRPITVVMDLGCWVLPSNRRSLKDQPVIRSHPNKAVDVAINQTFEKQPCFERFNNRLPFFGRHSNALPHMEYLSCSCLCCPRRRDVAQRLIDLAAGPQPMQ